MGQLPPPNDVRCNGSFPRQRSQAAGDRITCDQQWRGRAGLCPVASHVNLLGYRQSIIDLDAEVANRALDFVVAQQKLDRAQITGTVIDQRGLTRRAYSTCG